MIETNTHLISSDGTRLTFRASGPIGGDPVVLIAGWPQTLHAWRHVQDRLASAGVRSIAVDPPGLGGSDLLGPAERYATPGVAAIMADALAREGVERYALVGHDVGAWIAYAWACQTTPGLARLALLDAAIPGAMSDGAFALANAPRVFQFFFNAVPELPELLTAGRERVYLEWLFRTKARVAGAIGDEDVDEYMRCYGQPERMGAGFDYYRAVPLSVAALADVPRIAIPVLAVGAEHGVGEGLANALESRCADLEGFVVAGSGHFVPEEAPDELTDRLLAFLRARRDA